MYSLSNLKQNYNHVTTLIILNSKLCVHLYYYCDLTLTQTYIQAREKKQNLTSLSMKFFTRKASVFTVRPQFNLEDVQIIVSYLYAYEETC